MKTITLLQIQNEAKELQINQNITYNQALHKVAQKNGFKAYQSLLDKIKKDYIDDEDDQIKEFKSNVFDNRKHIKSNFMKIEKLSEKYEEIRFNEKYDDNEETRDELIEEIEEKAAELSNSIAKMFFGSVSYTLADNQQMYVEGCAYAGYTSSDYRTIHNDIDSNNADYFIELNIKNQNFSFFFRDFNIHKYEDIDNQGNKFIREIKEWNDLCQTPDIELHF